MTKDGKMFMLLKDACEQMRLDQPEWHLLERRAVVDSFALAVRVRWDETLGEYYWRATGQADWRLLARRAVQARG